MRFIGKIFCNDLSTSEGALDLWGSLSTDDDYSTPGHKPPQRSFFTHIGTLAGKEIPTGTFLISPGPVMASFDRFAITVLGKGCHGSTPENGIDPINIAAHIILSLEGIVTREISGCTPLSSPSE